MSRPLVFVVGALCWAIALAARAQTADGERTTADEAAAAFAEGQAAFDAERYDEALTHFSRAEELSPHPAILYNIAVCHEFLGQLVLAFEELEQVIRDPALDPASADQARERLERVRRQVAVVEVSSADVDALRARLSPDAPWCDTPCRWVVMPGPATLSLQDADGPWTRELVAEAGATTALTVRGRERTVVAGERDETTRPARAVAEAGPVTVLGTVLTVLGAAAAVTAFVLVNDARAEFERAGSMCLGDVCDRGLAFNVTMNVGWGLALVGGVLAIIDLFAIDHGTAAAAPEPAARAREWASGLFRF